MVNQISVLGRDHEKHCGLSPDSLKLGPRPPSAGVRRGSQNGVGDKTQIKRQDLLHHEFIFTTMHSYTQDSVMAGSDP
jgi:hypothetical protein